MEEVNFSLFLAVPCSMQDLCTQKERKKSPPLFFQKMVCCAEPRLPVCVYVCVCLCVCVCAPTARVRPVLSHFSHARLFVTPWAVALQAPLSMGFSRQEDWSGLPGPPPGDLRHPGMASASLMSLALAGGLFTTSATREALLSPI